VVGAAAVVGAAVVGAVVGRPTEPVLDAAPLMAAVPVAGVAAVAGVVAACLPGRGLGTVVGAASGALLVVGVVAARVELTGGKGCAVAVLPASGDEPPHAPSNTHAPSDVVRVTAMSAPLTCILR
jgi:hypothetical protein